MEHAEPQAADQARPRDNRGKTNVPRQPHARPRAAFWRAWAIWALTVGATVAGFIFNRTHPALASAGNQGNAADALAGVMFIGGFGTVGALLAWKRSANPIGWLLSAAGLSYAVGVASLSLAGFHRTLALSHWMGWIWLLGIGLTVFVVPLFPTGALPSRRWRPVAWATAAGLAGWVPGNYPPLLAGEGLVTALRAQARKSPVPAEVTADGVGRYPQDVEAVVYFCVLEALQNVAKYAGASRAIVRLTGTGDDLGFEVRDDGTGFDMSTKAYGTGLQGMADRLNALGGSLDIQTSPGTGTAVSGRIRCRIPEPAR